MKRAHRIRLIFSLLVLLCLIAIPVSQQPAPSFIENPDLSEEAQTAKDQLQSLDVKGRAPKTDYTRAQFGDGWTSIDGCDTRNSILARDLQEVTLNDICQVVSGVLSDPYTNSEIIFERGAATSARVQIDHVVALSNAWQTGAQQLSSVQRIQFANDPLELLAVDGQANQQKSDGDAATWLPKNKSFRCTYISRQIAVKVKYRLWVTPPEKLAMERILNEC